MVAAVEEAQLPGQMKEPVQRVELVLEAPPPALQQVRLHFGSVELLVDVAVSKPAFAFAFHDFDGLLLLQDHIQDIGRPYIDDSDSKRTVNSHNEEPNIFGPYTPRCVSTSASYLHSVVSLDIVHRRADIWQHA